MSKLYKCDKCEKIIAGNVFKLKLSSGCSDESEVFHLCNKCVGNFGLWIIRKEADGKGCYNCKYCSLKVTEEPCEICDHNDKWEAKDNGQQRRKT